MKYEIYIKTPSIKTEINNLPEEMHSEILDVIKEQAIIEFQKDPKKYCVVVKIIE